MKEGIKSAVYIVFLGDQTSVSQILRWAACSKIRGSFIDFSKNFDYKKHHIWAEYQPKMFKMFKRVQIKKAPSFMSY